VPRFIDGLFGFITAFSKKILRVRVLELSQGYPTDPTEYLVATMAKVLPF
jgi:hypothetical protein